MKYKFQVKRVQYTIEGDSQFIKPESCQSHIVKDRAWLAESVGEADSPGMWSHP